jgi:hypothetical protein
MIFAVQPQTLRPAPARRYRHGIDLKTHSQCQRSATLANQHDRLTRPNCLAQDLVSFHLSDMSSALAEAALHHVYLVEPIGIEPMTPCLQSRCSPS